MVDRIPESIIFGIQIAIGQTVGAAFLAAVWVSNIPQALAPSASLAEPGWGRPSWWGCGDGGGGLRGHAWLGYLAGTQLGVTGDRAAALAAGGLLAMLTDSLMPHAMQKGGKQAGIWTVVGFGLVLGGS